MLGAMLMPVVGAPQSAVFSADAVKAAFLYRFASYVEWPIDAPPGALVIAVAGAEEIATQLDNLLPRMTVQGRSAQVRRVKEVSDLDGVHILYIGPQVMKRWRSWCCVAVTRPILIVTDEDGGLGRGAVINFIEANRNVRFEISLVAADRAHLKITSALLSVAARVERRPQAWSGCTEVHAQHKRDASCRMRMASLQSGAAR